MRKGHRFKGRGEVIEAGAEFDRLVAHFTARWPDARRRIRAIVVVRVEQTRAVVSPGYDRDPDEAAMRERWVHFYQEDRG